MKRPALISAKRIALDKANTTTTIIVGVSVFISIFSLVAVKNLYSQMRYQSKVTSKKEKTLAQTKVNIHEEETLVKAYEEFSSTGTNIIGGNPKGGGDKDGENAKIVLDALPSKYDYPALTSSMDKLLKSNGFTLTSITGTDQEASESENSGGVDPEAVEIPFMLESTVNVNDGTKFLELFEKSIRPIVVNKVTLTSRAGNVKVTLDAKTFYQPEKKMNITEETVSR